MYYNQYSIGFKLLNCVGKNFSRFFKQICNIFFIFCFTFFLILNYFIILHFSIANEIALF